jgi:hypothetical protein
MANVAAGNSFMYSSATGLTFNPSTGNLGIGTTTLTSTLNVGGSAYISNNLVTGGYITAGGAVTAYSDSRLKTNIHIITNSLQKLLQLQGVTYERTDTGDRGRGMIAQNVQKLYPELVIENANGMLSVAYGNFIADVIEAIRELQDQIDDIKNNMVR